MSRDTSYGRASVVQVCAAFGISRQAYYQASHTPAAVVRLPRARRQGEWATAEELETKIQEVVAQNPGWGVRKVWAYLRRAKVIASRKRVWAMMRALGLVLPPVSEREYPRLCGHVAVPDSNRRWASDLTTVWTRQDGLVAVVPLVDCGDRVLLDYEVTVSQESPAVLAPLKRSLERVFGDRTAVPSGLELRTDHGPQYTGADCRDICRDWGLEHTFAPVGRPTGNAVAERLILTMKVELIWTRDWESADELRTALASWARTYNHDRPHQALAWKTPAEQRAMNLNPPRLAAA